MAEPGGASRCLARKGMNRPKCSSVEHYRSPPTKRLSSGSSRIRSAWRKSSNRAVEAGSASDGSQTAGDIHRFGLAPTLLSLVK